MHILKNKVFFGFMFICCMAFSLIAKADLCDSMNLPESLKNLLTTNKHVAGAWKDKMKDSCDFNTEPDSKCPNFFSFSTKTQNYYFEALDSECAHWARYNASGF